MRGFGFWGGWRQRRRLSWFVVAVATALLGVAASATASCTGGTVGSATDLGTFFGFTAGSGTDPRVVYDAAAGRFYAAYEGLPAGGDETDLAVSDNSDPTGGWTIYDIADNSSNVLQDQEKLGFTNDKVTLSWNNYDNTKNPQPFLGVVTAVVNKA